jgi:hypothetical protein
MTYILSYLQKELYNTLHYKANRKRGHELHPFFCPWNVLSSVYDRPTLLVNQPFVPLNEGFQGAPRLPAPVPGSSTHTFEIQ